MQKAQRKLWAVRLPREQRRVGCLVFRSDSSPPTAAVRKAVTASVCYPLWRFSQAEGIRYLERSRRVVMDDPCTNSSGL